jgi:hypothetical protein
VTATQPLHGSSGRALASLSFDNLSSAFTVAAARSPVTPSSQSPMCVITLGAVIGSGNGFVSPNMRDPPPLPAPTRGAGALTPSIPPKCSRL